MLSGILSIPITAELLVPGKNHQSTELPKGSKFEVIDTVPQTQLLSLSARLLQDMGVKYFIIWVHDDVYRVPYAKLIAQLKPGIK